MSVTVDDLAKQLNTEEEEEPLLELYLSNAKDYLDRFVNRDDLENNDPRVEKIIDQAVLELASNFYLKRDGSASGVSRSYSGLNYIIDSIRVPGIGFGESDD